MTPQENEISGNSADDLRRSILDTSRNLLIKEGYSSLSMRKIARSIGYSATSIYLHFTGKDQLVHALITEGMRLLMHRLQPIFDDLKLDPVEIIRRICHAYVEFGLANPGYYEIMYVLHPESITRYPEKQYREARALVENLRNVFARGMSLGIIDRSNPTTTANVLWSQMHGLVSLIHGQRFDRSLARDSLISDAVERSVHSCVSSNGSQNESL